MSFAFVSAYISNRSARRFLNRECRRCYFGAKHSSYLARSSTYRKRYLYFGFDVFVLRNSGGTSVVRVDIVHSECADTRRTVVEFFVAFLHVNVLHWPVVYRHANTPWLQLFMRLWAFCSRTVFTIARVKLATQISRSQSSGCQQYSEGPGRRGTGAWVQVRNTCNSIMSGGSDVCHKRTFNRIFRGAGIIQNKKNDKNK